MRNDTTPDISPGAWAAPAQGDRRFPKYRGLMSRAGGAMDKQLEERLAGLEEQLKRFVDVMETGLGRDLARPINAVRDGYYEAALTNAGSIIEAMLRDIWQREGIKGEGKKKTIEQLFSVVKEQAQMDRLVQDYIRDIQLVRNRAAHGEDIVAEDCLEALRKLAVILGWYFDKYVLGGEPEGAVTLEQVAETPPKRRLPWSRIALLGLLVLVILGAVMLKVGQQQRDALRKAQAEYRMVIAPFDAATTTARDEAITMRQLLFSALADVLEDEPGVRVMMPDSETPPRTDGEAQKFGNVHLADVTIWGRVISVGGETVIEPHIATRKPEGGIREREANYPNNQGLGELRAVESADDQFALRQAKANEIRDLAVILAVTHSKIPADRGLELLDPIATVDSFFYQAGLVQHLGHTDQRVRNLLEQALAVDPDHLPSLRRLALLEFYDRDVQKAAGYCDRLEITSGPIASSVCSVVYGELGRLEEAEHALERAIAENPLDASFYLTRYTMLLLRHGNVDRAVEDLNHRASDPSSNGSPTKLTARGLLATVYSWKHRQDDAVQLLTEGSVDDSAYQAVQGVDYFDLLLSYGLHDRAESLLDATDRNRDNPIRIVGPRVSLALARQDCGAARHAVDEALSDYYWAYGNRRWLAWSIWKDLIPAAFGLAREAWLTSDDEWIKRDFNPAVADQWHAYIRQFDGSADETSGFLSEKEASELVDWVWGWRKEPKAVAAYLAGDSQLAHEMLFGPESKLLNFPAINLLVLADTASESAVEDYLEIYRTNPEPLDWWMPTDEFHSYLAGEKTEAETWDYTPFHRWRFGEETKEQWTVRTALTFGAYFLATSDTEKAQNYLQRAVDTDLRYEIEWLLAKHALERIEAE